MSEYFAGVCVFTGLLCETTRDYNPRDCHWEETSCCGC